MNIFTFLSLLNHNLFSEHTICFNASLSRTLKHKFPSFDIKPLYEMY